jgi:mono/diheme cytochrome c family protein
MRIALFTIVALLVPAFSACSPAVTQKSGTTAGTAATLNGDPVVGKQVFQTNCAVCHGATGIEGGVVGPSLRHESMRMDYGATVSWVEDPQPPMPKLYPKMLTESQVRDVASYVQTL